MATRQAFVSLDGSEHPQVTEHTLVNKTAPNETMKVTLILHRKNANQLKDVKAFAAEAAGGGPRRHLTHAEFAAQHGADAGDKQKVIDYFQSEGLKVVETNDARRTVVVEGTIDAINKAFNVEMCNYDSPRGKYRSHIGPAKLPQDIAPLIASMTGLDEHKIDATHFSPSKRAGGGDPTGTTALTPQQVAALYNFPKGDGAGQVIGIYEMETQDGPPGYSVDDITNSIKAFGGGLKVPKITDVAVDGTGNSGASDGETGLDITVAGAIAQAATLAVYFTGGTSQNIIHELQQMIHPGTGDPVPTVISISYGFGPDDKNAHSFSALEFKAIGQLFQDAATLGITVLVSSGDNGAFISSKTHAQASYPATEPWVIACGGTTIGNIHGTSFDEWVWNDSGATGGGVSNGRFPVPDYQQSLSPTPTNIVTHKTGRGIPDIAGNASANSGYPQFVQGQAQQIGGTSAVAPLYAGLIAVINANIGQSVGFINPTLYSQSSSSGKIFRDIVGAPGPANNSFDGVAGYPAETGWDACTGLGSVNGSALQAALQGAGQPTPPSPPPRSSAVGASTKG
jgi:kumamolisin